MVSSGNGPGKRKESAVDDYYDIESLFDDPEQDDSLVWNLEQGLAIGPNEVLVRRKGKHYFMKVNRKSK